jgi:GWxTD domain-containing protein
MTPNISGNVGNLEKGFFFFFEYYPIANPDSVEFRYSFITVKGETVYTGSNMHLVTQNKMQVFLKIDTLDIPPGEYTLRLESHTKGNKNSSEIVSATQRQILLHWRGVPLSVKDLDDAINQLKYLAKEAEMDSLESATTSQEKQKRFNEFWKKRDPTPDTQRNELMEEYYQRVEFANKRFSRYRPGWKTDMGMIYIIFGPPNNVERHPFEMDSKPYEVWTYYDIRQQLIFIDETGFGDYRLQNLDWELYKNLPH